ncbi:potassium transporter TrkA [Longimycelium tulufanense]|uniref:Potassium transporter TrkA n=1 Tax=Longimycelium tulufanense TaxID=907463 RepID=A0A8J3CKX2_9PSEU|nr:potassium transporter TrkA [Longimycelium tulufanense]
MPGIGTRQDFVTRSGRRIGVVTHRDGRFDLIVSGREDPDACAASIALTPEESGTLANLLGAPQLVAQLDKQHGGVGGIVTRQLPIITGSPFDGRPLGDTAMRTRTGVSVVAIVRANDVEPSPRPDFVLRGADVLIAVGTPEGVDAAADLLAKG